MKCRPIQRGLALFTSLAMTAGMLTLPVLAAGAGTELHKSSITISDTARFVNRVSTHSAGRQESFVLEYQPGGSISPVVWSGSVLMGKNTIQAGADALTEQGYYVVGGINADFFSSSSGVPLGMSVENGRLISSDDGHAAIAFREDGSAFLSENPGLTFTLTNQGGGDPNTGLGLTTLEDTGEVVVSWNEETGEKVYPADHAGQTVSVQHFNKLRQSYYLYLLDERFGATNQATQQGRDVRFRVLSGTVSIGGTVELEVVSVSEGNTPAKLETGYLTLTANAQSPFYDELTKFAVGDKVTLTVGAADQRLTEAVWAVGGGDILIQDGAVTDSTGWDASVANSRNPRTAVGFKADGTVVLYAIDGRRSSYSNGLTLSDLAQELLELGCVGALNMDGGGSTTFLFREPDGDEYSIVNSPSDGSARKCSTFLYLVSSVPGDGTASQLYLNPADSVVLAGSQVAFGQMYARDEGYRPAALPEQVSMTAENGLIVIQEDQKGFLAGAEAGVETIHVQGGEASGTTTVTVVTEVDSLKVTRADTGAEVSALSLEPGQSVQLQMSATAKGENALCSPEAFSYTLSGANLGTITQQGLFTAGDTKGVSGTLQVTFGSRTVSIPITVGKEETMLVEDFEGSATLFTDASAGMYVTQTSSQVKLGSRSGVLAYDFSSASTVDFILPQERAFDCAVSRFAMWVRGDSSGATLSVLVRGGDGTLRAVPFERALDFEGYALLSAPVGDSGLTTLVGFRLEDTAAAGKSGSICVDQLVVPGQASTGDSTPPEIQMTAEGGVLTAVLSDDSGAAFTERMVSVAVDGVRVPFTLSGNTVTASYTLEGDGIHRITVTVGDVFGNLARKSVDILETAATNPFLDVMKDYWAHPYISYMYEDGVVNGADESHFQPDGTMTREALCTVLSRFLKVDTSAYESVELPFADSGAISDWALPHVKAMYSLGYMGGTTNDKGEQVFNPQSALSRAELFTLFGRIAPKGYENACKTTFTDQDTIPDWALSGVRTVVGMGLVGGYEDGGIHAGNTTSRAEVCKLLYAYL